MPCFVCAKCGCIDNTALGHYWSRERVFFLEGSLSKELVGKALCSECVPKQYSDGSPTGGGKWHGRFDKEHWSINHIEVEIEDIVYLVANYDVKEGSLRIGETIWNELSGIGNVESFNVANKDLIIKYKSDKHPVEEDYENVKRVYKKDGLLY